MKLTSMRTNLKPCFLRIGRVGAPALGLLLFASEASARDDLGPGGVTGVLLALAIGLGLGIAWGLGQRAQLRRKQRELDERVAELHQKSGQLFSLQQKKSELLDQMQRQTEEFARLAHEDALTGLPNGRSFDEAYAHNFSRSKRHGQPLSLMLLNLDKFSQVNDDWSHAAGDRVLSEVGRLLRSVCRTSDFPSRLGGDLFAIILTDTDEEGAWRLSQRLHAAFAGCRNWHEGDLGPNYISFSAGLVTLGDEDMAPVQLRHRADRALYLAKHAGGARTSLG